MAGNDTEARIRITGDSTGAEAAVAKTVGQLESLRKSANQGLGKIQAVEALRAGLDSLDSGVIKSTAQLEKERAQLVRLEAELRKTGIDTRNLSAEKARLEGQALRATRGIIGLKDALAKSRDEAASLGQSAGKAADGVSVLGIGLKGLAAGAAVGGILKIGASFVSANAGAESLSKSLESVFGSAEAASRELAFVREEADRLGLEVDSAAGSYVQLAASAKGTRLEGAATREIWSAVAESMARLGKTSAETDGALLAISQMMSKGVVSAEELRGQLGERLPGAFQAAARAMGTTTQGLGKMLESGQLVADDFLPKFAAELRRIGGGGGEINTFNAQMSRMRNSWDSLLRAVGDTGVFDLFTKIIGGLAWTLDRAVKGFRLLAQEVGLARPALEGAAQTSERAAAGVEKVGSQAADSTPKVKKLSEVVKDLNADLKTLGIDRGALREELGNAEGDFVAAFRRIASSSAANSEEIFRALLTAVDKVNGDDGLKSLMASTLGAFRAGKISADQLGASLDAINSKSAGLWKGLSDSAIAEGKAIADAQKKLNDNLRTMVERARDLRAKAAAGSRDDSIEGQALATLDLIAAEEKLLRLKQGAGTVQDVERQAELVRQIAGTVNDQARAQEAVRNSYQYEADALERTAASARQVKDSSGVKILADTALQEIDQAVARINELKNTRIKVEMVVVPMLEDGRGGAVAFNRDAVQDALNRAVRGAALERGT